MENYVLVAKAYADFDIGYPVVLMTSDTKEKLEKVKTILDQMVDNHPHKDCDARLDLSKFRVQLLEQGINKELLRIMEMAFDDNVIYANSDTFEIQSVYTESSAQEKLNAINKILYRYSQIDGAHHKAWCIDQIARILHGDNYEQFVREFKYVEWDIGIAP